MKIILSLNFLIILSSLTAQTKTNFEIVDSLIFLSTENISTDLDKNEEYFVEFIAADDYEILKSKVFQFLKMKDFNITDRENNKNKLTYNLEEVKINYTDIFKEGIFGTFLVKREADIKGSYLLTQHGKIEEVNSINFFLADTILYSEVSQLDNVAYSFTSAEIPEEPFFYSALEPVIAIGTAAVAVYLFFNIRSR